MNIFALVREGLEKSFEGFWGRIRFKECQAEVKNGEYLRCQPKFSEGVIKNFSQPSISQLLTVLLFLVLSGLFTVAKADTYGYYTYSSDGFSISITKYTGNEVNVAIPNTIRGTQVTSIGDNAFSSCASLTNIVIPNSVTNIGNYAFYGCTGLANIAIPDSVISIGAEALNCCVGMSTITVGTLNTNYASTDGVLFDKSQTTLIQYPPRKKGTYIVPNGVINIGTSAFSQCIGLTKITLSENATSIGDSAFSQCAGLTNITFFGGVTSIGSYAFYGCSGLTSIPVPHSVAIIGTYAFKDCTGLNNITIPESVSEIGDSAFFGCNSLTNITVDALNLAYSSMDGALFNKSQTTIIEYPDGNGGGYAIPNSVTNIGIGAFSYHMRMTSVVIPNSIRYIGDSAFEGCTGLTNIVIYSGVISIGNRAFLNCNGMKSFKIPNSVTNIGEQAFYGCNGLTSIPIPDNVTSIGDSAFYNCTSLKSVTIPNSITRIGNQLFSGCTDLMNVTIPDSVTLIGLSAFFDCRSLTNIVIPNSINTISGDAFYNCGLTIVSIPNSVTSIQSWAFYNCRDLTSVTIPNSITNIEAQVFSGCSSLTNIVIPNSVTSIDVCAFKDCISLKSVTIPDSVTNIGMNAFSDCTRLRMVYFVGDALTSVPDGLFYNDSNVTVRYRAETTGWGTTFAGRPTALWIQQPLYNEWVKSVGLLDQYPDSSDETADADHDGMSNFQEWQAGTDPTNPNSVLRFELKPRPDDLVDADKTPLGLDDHALYLQTMPFRQYDIQSKNAIDGVWQTEVTVAATTTQKRITVFKGFDHSFYRVILVP
jgi:hypothetical protein